MKVVAIMNTMLIIYLTLDGKELQEGNTSKCFGNEHTSKSLKNEPNYIDIGESTLREAFAHTPVWNVHMQI